MKTLNIKKGLPYNIIYCYIKKEKKILFLYIK